MITNITTPVQVNLSDEQQQAINKSRRDICSESTRINYNKNIIKFINFLEECCGKKKGSIKNAMSTCK